MVIYLKHPVHGTKVACSDIEADHDKRNGWSEYNPDEEIRFRKRSNPESAKIPEPSAPSLLVNREETPAVPEMPDFMKGLVIPSGPAATPDTPIEKKKPGRKPKGG